MRPFMSNQCMHPYCKRCDCEKCFFFSPKFFGVRVPKKVGNFLFDIEDWLFRMERRFFKH